VTLAHYLAVSAFLFLLGLFGALTRRNIIGILMGVELMFNSANLNLVAMNRFLHPIGVHGSAVTLFTIAVAAAEIVVGLSLVIAIYRNRNTIYAEDISLLKG
jgi:NADH:ubiquinone oxidoreductase subunit K